MLKKIKYLSLPCLLGFFAVSNLYTVIRSPILGDDLYSPFAIWIASKGDISELLRIIPFGLENGHVSLLGRVISYLWNFNWIWFGTQQFPGNHLLYYEITRLFSIACGAIALILLFKIISTEISSSLRTKIYLSCLFCSTLTYYGLNSHDPTASYPLISYPTVLLGLVPLWIYINNSKKMTRTACLKIFFLSVLAIGYYELNFSLILTFSFLFIWKKPRLRFLAPVILIAICISLQFYSSDYSGTDINFSINIFLVIINSLYSSIPILAQVLLIANSTSKLLGISLLFAIFFLNALLCLILFRKFKGKVPRSLASIGIRYEGVKLILIFLAGVLIIQGSTFKSQIELVEIGRVYTANPYLHLFWVALIYLSVTAFKNFQTSLTLLTKKTHLLLTCLLASILFFNISAVHKTEQHFALSNKVLNNWDLRDEQFCTSLESWNREDWPEYYREEFTQNISKSARVFLNRSCKIED